MGNKQEMVNKCGWDNCLTCPYPLVDCPLERRIYTVSLARKKRAIELGNSGMWPKEIAVALGLSKRQVERYLKEEQVKQRQDHIVSKYKEG